jgi:hypothetical protein
MNIENARANIKTLLKFENEYIYFENETLKLVNRYYFFYNLDNWCGKIEEVYDILLKNKEYRTVFNSLYILQKIYNYYKVEKIYKIITNIENNIEIVKISIEMAIDISDSDAESNIEMAIDISDSDVESNIEIEMAIDISDSDVESNIEMAIDISDSEKQITYDDIIDKELYNFGKRETLFERYAKYKKENKKKNKKENKKENKKKNKKRNIIILKIHLFLMYIKKRCVKTYLYILNILNKF